MKPSKYIKNEELRIIDGLLGNQIVDKILSYERYSSAMKEYSPSLFLRAEILKTVKYPEIGCRIS